jgi:hypothetical protein
MNRIREDAMRLSAVGILAVAMMAGSVVQLSEYVATAAEERSQMLTGTVTDLNAAEHKLTVKTDLEKNIYVDVAQPDLLREVHAGDRVTLRLSADGKADKITKLTVPELPAPADAEPRPEPATQP